MFRELILLRHAKSDWTTGVADEYRPLNPRGRRDATALGGWLTDQGQIDEFLISPATRTVQTYSLACTDPLLSQVKSSVVDDLYEASLAELTQVVRDIDNTCSRVVVVGHNPSIEYAARYFANDESDQGAMLNMNRKFPTAAAAVLSGDLPWRQWRQSCAALVTFRVPLRPQSA